MSRFTPSITAGVCAAAAFAFAAPAAVRTSSANVRETLRELPLRFEPNQGQWNSKVRFRAATADYQVNLTARGAAVSFAHRTIGISLVRGNSAPAIAGTNSLPSFTNYFSGKQSEWRRGVTNFGRVRYQSVYPGIDMVYYGSGRQLEYDFVLAAGADPARIRLRFRGADRIRITPEGDLLLQAGGEKLVQKRPYIYQGSREIGGRYRMLARNVVGVEPGAYDRSRPLTIDPILIYSSLLGGTASDSVSSVKVDAAGILYVAGYVTQGVQEGSDGSQQNADGSDAFVAKIDPTKSGADSLIYISYLGGPGGDVATDMAIDDKGNIYLTGWTQSVGYPTTEGAPQTTLNGETAQDAFVAKVQPRNGDLVFSTYLGGTGPESGNAIDVDKAGNIYVVGTTRSSDFPTTPNAYANVMYGPQDAFIAKIDPNAPAVVYSSYYGGEDNDDGRGVAVAPDGTVYVAGSTNGTQLPVEGFNMYRHDPAGAFDLFLARMDFNQAGEASIPYATYIGGSASEEVRRIRVDAAGKVLLTGYTLSSDFPVTGDAVQPSRAGNADVFVMRFDTFAPRESAVLYATYLGGSSGEVAYDLTTDADGMVYLTGYTLSKDFPVSSDALAGEWGGGADVFIVKLDPAGHAVTYATYLGKLGDHTGFGVAVGPDGTIFAGGYTPQEDVFVTPGAVQNGYNGGLSDGFVVALAPSQ